MTSYITSDVSKLPNFENLSTMQLKKISKEAFKRVGAPVFILVNLDAVAHNVNVLQCLCHPNTGIMGVVKGGAYGSGILPVVDTLLEKGVKELAVATVSEGVFLRKHGITVPINVVGNMVAEEVKDVSEYHLYPTVCCDTTLKKLDDIDLHYSNGVKLSVNIKIDTGMSRFGVQVDDLPDLVRYIDSRGIGIRSMFTHLQSSITEYKMNKVQYDKFIAATEPYLSRSILRHVAATTGCVQGIGTDLDFIRPGGCLTGLSSGSDEDCVNIFQKFKFAPSFSVIGKPSFYKLLSPCRVIGYDAIYETKSEEWIANFVTGWSDGYLRRLSNFLGYVKKIDTGEKCPVVGRVSMDSITVKLPCAPNEDEIFHIITDDFDEHTSAVGIARNVGAAVYEVPGIWSSRLSRVYIRNGKIVRIMKSLCYSN